MIPPCNHSLHSQMCLEISIDNFGIITKRSLCFIGEPNFTWLPFFLTLQQKTTKFYCFLLFYYSFTLPRYPLMKTRKSETLTFSIKHNFSFSFTSQEKVSNNSLQFLFLFELFEMVNPPLQSPTNPHFFQPLLPGFHSHLVRTLSLFMSLF